MCHLSGMIWSFIVYLLVIIHASMLNSANYRNIWPRLKGYTANIFFTLHAWDLGMIHAFSDFTAFGFEPYGRWSLEVCFRTLCHCSFSCLPWNKNLASSNWKSIQIGFGVHLDYGNLVLFCFVSSAAFFKQYIWIIVGAVT